MHDNSPRGFSAFRVSVVLALGCLVAMTISVIGLLIVLGSSISVLVKETKKQAQRDAVLSKLEKMRGLVEGANARIDGLEKNAGENERRLKVIESLNR